MKRTTRAQWGGQRGHIRRTTRTQWGGLHGNNEEDRADTMRRTEQTQWRGPYRDTMRRTTQTQWGGTRQTQWGGRHGNMRRITWRTMRRTTRTHQEDHTNTWGEPHGHNEEDHAATQEVNSNLVSADIVHVQDAASHIFGSCYYHKNIITQNK